MLFGFLVIPALLFAFCVGLAAFLDARHAPEWAIGAAVIGALVWLLVLCVAMCVFTPLLAS